jgi:hypothetical protein
MAVSDELMTTIALRLEATVREMLSRTPGTGNLDDVPRPFGGAPLLHRPSSRDVPMLLMKSAPLSCLYEYRGDYKRNVRSWAPATCKNIVAVPHVPGEARENSGSATHPMWIVGGVCGGESGGAENKKAAGISGSSDALVEVRGLEPLASGLQSPRSPS